MRLKYTMQTVVLSLSLSLGLSLFTLPARAQTGSPVSVNGINYVPTSGTTISTVGNSPISGRAVQVFNGGTLFGANDWTLSTSGNGVDGALFVQAASFSGTNLNVSTTGSSSNGLLISARSTVTLTGGTITTQGDASNGFSVSTTSVLTFSGVSVSTSGSGASGVFENNLGSVTASGVNISTSGSDAHGIHVQIGSTFSGTDVNIQTTGANAHAIYINNNGGVSITGGTLTTMDTTAAGIMMVNNGTATLSNVAVNVAGDFVSSISGVHTVTFDNVQGTIGANVLNAVGGINTLNLQNSALGGNLTNSGTSAVSAVNLVSGTLAGAANRTGGTLNVSVDSASEWVVNASSTLSNLTNQGVVDMHTSGALRHLSVTNFTQETGASIAMTLAGAGGAANELVNVNGQLTLAGSLILNGDAGQAAASSEEGGFFVLFNKTSTGALTGGFDDITLNGVSYGTIADGGTFTDGTYTYTLSYQGNAATGALTGGNDVLLHVVPEPGTWAMLVGGLGLLVAGQRLRRRSRG